jgi:hypothetical protein
MRPDTRSVGQAEFDEGYWRLQVLNQYPASECLSGEGRHDRNSESCCNHSKGRVRIVDLMDDVERHAPC